MKKSLKKFRMNEVINAMILAILLCSSSFLTALCYSYSQDIGQWESNGPRVDEIFYSIILNPDSQKIALKKGDVHMMPDLVRPVDIEELAEDTRFKLYITEGYHMFYLCFNMRREPFIDVNFRNAIAYIVDKENITRTIFKGYVAPLDTFVLPVQGEWFNSNVSTCSFNPDKARQILDNAGYVYDSNIGRRINPRTGEPLRDLILLTPTYEVAPTSAEIGRLITEEANKIGLPFISMPMDFPIMIRKTGFDRDFDMYVLARSLGRFPTHLYRLFHSKFDIPGAQNTPGINNTELDDLLEKLWYSSEKNEVKNATYEAQKLLSELLPYVPIYSRYYIYAFSADWEGAVNMKGIGAGHYGNEWTWLNIHHKDEAFGGVFKRILPEKIDTLNPLISTSAYEWMVLSPLYSDLLTVNPETMQDMPWMAKSWERKEWEYEDGKKGSVITFHLLENITWQDGVPFTSEDIKFCLEYLRDNRVPLYYSMWENLVFVETPDKYTASIYLNETGYWFLYEYSGTTFMPKHIWENVEDYESFKPWEEAHPEAKDLTKLIGTGPFIFKEHVPGEFVRLKWNPLFFKNHPDHKDLTILETPTKDSMYSSTYVILIISVLFTGILIWTFYKWKAKRTIQN
jgi:peptide/nickel transport system substrate-binding protein